MARIDTLNNFLTDVADAIREKKGTTEEIPAANFDTEIESIPSGGGVDINDYFNLAPPKNKDTLASWILEVPDVDTSALESAQNMFQNCSSLTTIPLLDTSKVINMSYMFQNCSSLTTIPLLDTSKVINMQFFAYQCSKLSSLPMFNTSALMSLSYAFNGCRELTSFPSWDMSNLQSIDSCFGYCNKLVSIPKLNLQKVTNVVNMFYQNDALTDLGGFENLGQAYSTTQSANYRNYELDLSRISGDLTHDSLMNVINNLYDIATKGVQAQQLTIGATHLAKLTEDEIKIATDKGWTVS